MTTSTVNIEDLRVLIAGALEAEPEDVTDGAHFTEELEIDSLMLLEISTRVESKYGVPVDDIIISGVQTLTELHAYVSSKVVGEPTA